jgi:receptor protein-tyrosine kinase
VSDKRPTSVIERAAQRLAQLKSAGIEVPAPAPAEAAPQRDGSATIVEAMARTQASPAHGGAAMPGHAGAPAFNGSALAPAQRPAAVPGTSDPATPKAQRVIELAAEAPELAPDETPVAQPARKVDIDFARLESMGYLSPTASRSQLADEFRVIKRTLLHNIAVRPAEAVNATNLIMVTSALPGEGKTFTAINLALSMASEFDRTVLLIDADVQRPAVLDRLGLPRSKGLLDLLTDSSVALHEVLLRTNVDKLSILPPGTAHAQATELLASEAMDRLLLDLSTRYPDRVIVFDAPPLLASTESRVLATHMGQVIMVVAADKTPQGSLMEAMRTVESCPLVYSVLNKTRRASAGSYYGYYGYGY